MEFWHPDPRHADGISAIYRQQQKNHHGAGPQRQAPAQELPDPQRQGHHQEAAQQVRGEETRCRGEGRPGHQGAQILHRGQVG